MTNSYLIIFCESCFTLGYVSRVHLTFGLLSERLHRARVDPGASRGKRDIFISALLALPAKGVRSQQSTVIPVGITCKNRVFFDFMSHL